MQDTPSPSLKPAIAPSQLALDVSHLTEAWVSLSPDARRVLFRRLLRAEAEELFLRLKSSEQHELIEELPYFEKRSWLRLLAPDDVADLIQEFPAEERSSLLSLLDHDTQKDVEALMAYEEDDAGGLMNSKFIRLRPDVSVDVAIRYLRAQAKTPVEMISYAYVLGNDQKLLGVVSFRDLLLASPEKLVTEIMKTDLITVPEDMDQEEVSRRLSHHGLIAVPVIDAEGRMKGIVTVDDAVEVVEEEATEDMQKIGGMEALDAPYLQVGFFDMLKKRAGWLTILFIGEMFTAVAMGYFERQIERAVVLALFIPLIISSGGNSGSQASTLIIRAMALREVTLRDWWRVLGREITFGLSLGGILGGIGLIRVMLWPTRATVYGEHYELIALTLAGSLVGIVLWGTIAGSMLPFALRRFGWDPASASAPLVATLVDVTGIVIYFTVASLLLSGTLL